MYFCDVVNMVHAISFICPPFTFHQHGFSFRSFRPHITLSVTTNFSTDLNLFQISDFAISQL